jgi:hypothetical protein
MWIGILTTGAKVCSVNLCVRMISSEDEAGSNYARLIGVNGRQRKHHDHSRSERSMFG